MSLKGQRQTQLVLVKEFTRKCSNNWEYLFPYLISFIKLIKHYPHTNLLMAVKYARKIAKLLGTLGNGAGSKANVFITKVCRGTSKWAERQAVYYPRTCSSSEKTKLYCQDSNHSLLESPVLQIYIHIFSPIFWTYDQNYLWLHCFPNLKT